MTAAIIAHWIFQPLHGNGYQFWSGIAGSFLTSVPGWLIALALFLRQRNCHVHRCPRLSWHAHPDHGHPVCRHHHPHDPRALPTRCRDSGDTIGETTKGVW